MDLKGSRTEENLKLALQGEALAYFKYQIYKSKIGKFNKEYEKIIEEISNNEKEHGKIWFKLINNGVPDNVINLMDAIKGEEYEYCELYPEFARIAREEDFEDIAELFEAVADIEGRHCSEFKSLLDGVTGEVAVFDSDECSVWKCLNCGHIVSGESAPKVCDVCGHSLEYFVKL